MASYRMTINIKGLDEVVDKLGTRAAAALNAKLELDMAEGAQNIAISAYKNAPVETGALRASILKSVDRVGDKEYLIGSKMPYAQRQEYEHKVKRMFLHRAVWYQKPRIERDIENTIKRHFD